MTGYIQLSDEAKLSRLVAAFDDEESPVRIVSAEEASSISGWSLIEVACTSLIQVG